jgi:hypothetical protein
MKQINKYKKCPICKNYTLHIDAELIPKGEFEEWNYTFKLGCSSCHAEFSLDKEDKNNWKEQIDFWNRQGK